jgi:hypothetical protein
MVCLSLDVRGDTVDIHGISDHAAPVEGTLSVRFVRLDGGEISQTAAPVTLNATAARLLAAVDTRERLGGTPKRDAAVIARLLDGDGNIVAQQNALLTPDKKARLQKPDIRAGVSIQEGIAALTLRSDVYARYVRVEVAGIDAPLSDNFFDLEAGQTAVVRFPVPGDTDAEALAASVTVTSLADIPVKGTPAGDAFRRFLFRLKPYNFLTWLLYKFV